MSPPSAYPARRAREHPCRRGRTARCSTSPISPLPIGDLGRVEPVGVDKQVVLEELTVIDADQLLRPRRHSGISGGHLLGGLNHQMVTAGPVSHLHVEWGGRGCFLSLPVCVESLILG